MRVSQIATEYERMGWTPDNILQAHPHLSLAAIHDALSYYYDNTAEIHEEWRRAEELEAGLRAQQAAARSDGVPTDLPQDETDYLLHTPANARRLRKWIRQIEAGCPEQDPADDAGAR